MALVLILLCFLFLTFPAALSRNIPVGSSFTASETSTPWLSPSGDFAFGFQRLPNATDLFVLSIWFAAIPDRTIVWFDRSSYPVPRGSVLRLDAADGLVLRNPSGRLLYSTDRPADRVSSAFLNDTGNLVLLGSGSALLWQSFHTPADTILPTQTIEIGGRGLASRKSGSNFSEGRFYAAMSEEGDFVLNTKSVPSNTDPDAEYYSSSQTSGYRVVFDERGSISVATRNGEQQALIPDLTSSISSDYYYRATLDFDGVFTRYQYPRNSTGTWTDVGSLPENICTSITGGKGSGACGYNSICSLESGRPQCRCPLGFSFSDPNNEYGDCKPNHEQSCVQGDDSNEYELLRMEDTDWPLNDYQQIDSSTEDVCRNACANDCFCAAAIFRSQTCWKKKLPLTNGRVDTNLQAVAFLKFRKGDTPLLSPNPPNNTSLVSPKDDRRELVIIGSVLLGSSGFVNILFITAACFVFYLRYSKKLSVSSVDSVKLGTNLRCFSYKELVQVTDGFKEEVGRGAFGIVYKGVIPNNVIAVKKLVGVAHDSEKEFKTEVNSIGQTHHKNLVPLIGFCSEGPDRLLVYEYMSNGTLADFLFVDTKPSWSQRTQIAFGVARGLIYLHEECSTQIIHCDIKPQNILLDEYLNPRISDFGLAKIMMMNQSNTLTNIRGTKGYVAPEWFRNMKITAKVDVYSFGVVLLEIVSCRRNVENMDSSILIDWVWDCFDEGRLDALVGNDADALGNGKIVERFVKVGIWCIQEKASLRPSMRSVFQMLEGSVEVEVPPCPYPNNSEVVSCV